MFSSSVIIKAIDQFSPVANKIRKGYDKITAGARKAVAQTKSFSKAISQISKAKALLTGAVSYYTFRTLKDFSEAFQGVKSIANETTVSFDQLSAQAKLLGRDTIYSATDAARAQYFLAQAGYDTQKIYDSMPQTLLLASAANMDIAQSAEIVTNIMAGYQMTSDQLTEAVDVLAKSFSSSKTNLSDLGTAMTYAGPVAAGMGIQFKETAAALGLMANAGYQGSLGGTALRAALARLSKPTKEVQRYIKGLRLDLYKSNGDIKSLTEIVEQLEKSGAKTSHMLALFGQRAGPAMAALVSQGSAKLRELNRVLDKSTGFAAKSAEIRMQGLSGAWENFTGSVESLTHAIGDAGLNDALVNTLNVLSDITNKMSEFVDKFGRGIIDNILSMFGGELVEQTTNVINNMRRKSYMKENLITNDPIRLMRAQQKIRELQESTRQITPIVPSNNQSTVKNLIEMSLLINDKNNNVGNIQTRINGPASLSMNVGRSSMGEAR